MSNNTGTKNTTFLKKINVFHNKINFLIVTIVALSLLCSILGGYIIIDKFYPQINLPTRFVTNPKNNGLQELIEREYLYKTPSSKEFTEGMNKGLVGALNDPYSEYLPAKEKASFDNELNKKYEGIGVVFDFRDMSRIRISTLIKNSPAQEIDLQSGDILSKINDQSIQGLTLSEIINKIRGQEGTKVKLEIVRDNNLMTFDITRRQINMELITVTYKDDTAIINIASFGEKLDEKMNSVAQEIKSKPEIKKLVIDVRNNPGGLLREAVDVISYFVEPNTLILKEKSKYGYDEIKSLEKKNSLLRYPTSVVINENSASASEILAGALRDIRNVKLVGRKSFGKGLVQQVFSLSNGDSIKLTTAEWVTPKNHYINKTGLNPDIEIKNDEDPIDIAIKNL
jgi:carboxyl-terminal processing protease